MVDHLVLCCKFFLMTHIYSISGMTCENCVKKVKSELLKIEDVLQADVQLSSPQATITMHKYIPVSILQNAISKAGHYTISEMPEHHGLDNKLNKEKEKDGWRSYWPLILVFSFITL